MKGFVGDNNRAMLPVDVCRGVSEKSVSIESWIDTAFDGHFVFSSNLIKELNLDRLVETEAILADGSKVVLQTYVCYLNWFGENIAAQVVENDGQFPLLGTALLVDSRLVIDYAKYSTTKFLIMFQSVAYKNDLFSSAQDLRLERLQHSLNLRCTSHSVTIAS